jgi:hypothetical protein
MYLVMENPVSSLYLGESVQFKAHALCDQSSVGSVSNGNETCHGTLFLTNYRLLFWSFDVMLLSILSFIYYSSKLTHFLT